MKKQLLATTALAAAGAVALSGTALAQDKKTMSPTLTIKGFHEQAVGFANSDRTDGKDLDGFHVTSDTEIIFAVRSELDNGLTVRGEVELEGKGSGTIDPIDEAFVAVSGSFGDIRMGANDEAVYEMTFGYQGAVSTGAGNFNLIFDSGNWIPGPGDHLSGPGHGRVNVSSDADLIAYYTPRFSGFQFGASYARTGDEDTNAIEDIDSATVDDTNIFTIAGNYEGKFGDVGVALAVGYGTSEGLDAVAGTAATDGDDADSLLDSNGRTALAAADGKEVWGGGLRLDFSGVRIGAGYIHTENDARAERKFDEEDDTIELVLDENGMEVPNNLGDIRTLPAIINEYDYWDVGARYTMGPHSFRISYFNVSQDDSPNETSAGILTYARTLGPGVTWSVDAMWADYETADGDADGTAIATGILIKF